MRISNEWESYKCIASGDGEKIERWGDIVLRRPDPQIIWNKDYNNKIWNMWDAFYHRSNKGGGYWEYKKSIPDSWIIKYKDLRFKVSPTNFKHTGIFPEQAVNWDYIMEKVRNYPGEDMRILNLFAYTGCATMAASSAGASSFLSAVSSLTAVSTLSVLLSVAVVSASLLPQAVIASTIAPHKSREIIFFFILFLSPFCFLVISGRFIAQNPYLSAFYCSHCKSLYKVFLEERIRD